MPHRPRILLSNDDGISAPGLQALADALDPHYDLTIVAPDRERSGAGHGINVRQDLRLERFHRADDHWGWSFQGTPADCVKMAIVSLCKDRPFDLAVSGINLGQNLGVNILYSGTVAAAREAAWLGVPAIALSQTFRRDPRTVDFDAAARLALPIVRRTLETGLPPKVLLNVNFPHAKYEDVRGYRVTRQGDSGFHDRFERIRDHPETGGATYQNVGERFNPSSAEDPDLDDRAIREKFVSITPLLVDATAHEWLGELRGRYDEAIGE